MKLEFEFDLPWDGHHDPQTLLVEKIMDTLDVYTKPNSEAQVWLGVHASHKDKAMCS